MTTKELAFVVGGSGSIGRVIVARLLEQGLDVVAVGRSQTALDELAQYAPGVRALTADMSDDSAIANIKQAAGDATVRVVVHAPGLPIRGGITDAEPGAIAEAVNIKCGGMLRLVRGVEDNLVRGSRLLAIGGHYGFEPTAYAVGPGVANAALPSLMRQLNLAYGEKGITANLLAPGPADTERLRKVAATRAERAGKPLEAVLEDMRNESAIKAFVTPEQVAWMVVTLLAPEADALCGSAVYLDAGRRKGAAITVPVMNIHLVADQFSDAQIGALLHRCAVHYGKVLGSPMERIRVFVSEHRPQTFFVDGKLASEGADAAPYFQYIVLQGRPQSEIEALMTGFTDILEAVLGVDRGRIRGACWPVPPEHWGIGGVMASVKRADEVAARKAKAARENKP